MISIAGWDLLKTSSYSRCPCVSLDCTSLRQRSSVTTSTLISSATASSPAFPGRWQPRHNSIFECLSVCPICSLIIAPRCRFYRGDNYHDAEEIDQTATKQRKLWRYAPGLVKAIKNPERIRVFFAQHFQNISMNKGRQNTHQKTQLLRKKPTHADR